MILHVEDAEVAEMAAQLTRLRGTSEADVLRSALRRELAEAREQEAKSKKMRENIAALQERVRQMTGPNPQPVTKEWIDSLYEDD
jgi:hypothetical protein